MTFVSEAALRELVREALTPSGNLSMFGGTEVVDLPVLVNPSVDSELSLANDSVIDVQFVPRDKTEFEVAVKALTKNVPDEVIPSLYAKVRDLITDVEAEDCEKSCVAMKHGDKDMDMDKKTVEEAVRKVVRKVLSERRPTWKFSDPDKHRYKTMGLGGQFKDVGDKDDEERVDSPDAWEPDVMDSSGESDGPYKRDPDIGEYDDDVVMTMADLEKMDTSAEDAETSSAWDPDKDADEDEKQAEPVSAPAEKKSGRRKLDHGVGHGEHGKSFDEIATEMGFSVSGAKRLEHVALKKLAYMMDLGPTEASKLVLDGVEAYIERLAKTGELSEDEVHDMYDHADVVASLDGFREFFHGFLRKEMKKDGEEFFPGKGGDEEDDGEEEG